jgi:hypothetical protein
MHNAEWAARGSAMETGWALRLKLSLKLQIQGNNIEKLRTEFVKKPRKLGLFFVRCWEGRLRREIIGSQARRNL